MSVRCTSLTVFRFPLNSSTLMYSFVADDTNVCLVRVLGVFDPNNFFQYLLTVLGCISSSLSISSNVLLFIRADLMLFYVSSGKTRDISTKIVVKYKEKMTKKKRTYKRRETTPIIYHLLLKCAWQQLRLVYILITTLISV